MDWKTLYFDANGRIGQRDFWLGYLILIGVSVIVGFIPVIGQIAQLVLTWAGVCLMSKRLHDFGKTGWLAAVPYAIGIVAMLLMLMSTFGLMAAGSAAGAGDATAGMGAFAAAGMAGIVLMLAFLVGLAFLLWVGLTKGDAGDNQYGPPPRQLIGGDATTPAL